MEHSPPFISRLLSSRPRKGDGSLPVLSRLSALPHEVSQSLVRLIGDARPLQIALDGACAGGFSLYGTATPWYPFIMESPRPNRLFSRIREAARHLFRRQPPPAMIGTPPSQRPTWHDPAAHARDFAERYATELDYAVSQRMIELGIPDDCIGTRNFGYGPPRLAFRPLGVDGGHIESNGVEREVGSSQRESSNRRCHPQYVQW